MGRLFLGIIFFGLHTQFAPCLGKPLLNLIYRFRLPFHVKQAHQGTGKLHLDRQVKHAIFQFKVAKTILLFAASNT